MVRPGIPDGYETVACWSTVMVIGLYLDSIEEFALSVLEDGGSNADIRKDRIGMVAVAGTTDSL